MVRAARVAGGRRAVAGGRIPDRVRCGSAAGCGRRGGRLLPVVRVPRGRARAGAVVRRRGSVPGGRRGHGQDGQREHPTTAGEGVRHRRRHDRRTEPRRDGRAVDPRGARDDARAVGPCQAARLCHRAPGQHRVVASSGVQPDQPAGIPRRGPVVSPFHRGDGTIVAGGRRRRIPIAALAFRAGSGRAAAPRAGHRDGKGSGVRAGGAGR